MTQYSFVFKIFFTFIFLSWFYLLVSSAAGAESVPFPKEPIATSTHRMDDKLNERFGGGIGGSGSGNNGDRDNYVLAFINFTYSALDGEEIRRSEEKARYGEGRILNVQGHLVHVTREHNISDHTACTENIRGTLNKPLPPRGEPWIALVRRGSCTFEKKIRHVWLQGAAGVIVYNDEASVTLEKMKIIEKDRNITAVFTFRWIGEEMARVADSNQKVWVSISEGSRTYRPTNINKTSVLFVSISFIILMVISLVWLIFYYIQRFRYLQSKDQNERNLCSAAKRIIMKIPTKSGKTDEKESDTDCCAICIENYKSTDCIRVLPCRHEFHKNCIDPWLLEHRTCPMCKLDILKHYGFVVGDPIIVSLPPESPSASPLVPLNSTTATTTSAIQLSPSARNNTTSVAIVTRPNFDPSQLEEIIEPSSLITPALNNNCNNSSSNSFNCNISASSTILPAIAAAAATSSSTSLTTTLSANSNNSNCSNARNTDLLLERNQQQQQQHQQQPPQHQHLLLKQNNNDILLSGGNNSKILNAKNIANNSNNSYSNLSNNSNNIINNSNNYKLNRNNSLNRNTNNLQQYNNRQNLQHTQIHNQNMNQQHHNHNHHHNSHPHQHQHSHSLSSIIVTTTTNDDINQQNLSSNSNISNSNNYQLPRISTSANHILQNFSTTTTTNSTTPTSSRQIIGSEESFLDLDLDAELGRSRLSRHRNSDQSASTTNTSDRDQAFNRASLRSTTSGSDNTHLLQVPNSRRRVRSSSLQLLSPFNKRHENRKSLQTANNLSPDDIRNFDMDLNNTRSKPVHHRRLRSRSADTCRDRKSTGFLDYYKFKNEASTSNGTSGTGSGPSKTKQFLENIQMQSSAAFGNNSGATIKSSPLRRHSSDISTSREITTPCNITIRIISDDDSISDCEDKNIDIDDSTSHL